MSDPAPQSPAEIKATAHLMLLEPGAYCVFISDAASDAATGLPGVRLSPAPAPSGGQVAITGFSPGGWLGARDDAALVRVSGASSPVLVTIYQAAVSAQPAPKLQVVRLSAGGRQGAATPVELVAHIYGRGDVPSRLGEWVGERGSRRWIEGFGLQPQRLLPATDLEYQAVLGRGWLSPWFEGGQYCGSRGMSLPILGMRVRLRGESAARHSVAVMATFVDGSAVGPVLDGAACEAPSLAALEAFQVSLLPKAEPLAKPARRPKPGPAKR